MLARPTLILLLLPLAACTTRAQDWPTLAPRPGEISPMVPRNVAGQMRCPTAVDCAPPPAALAAELIAPAPAPPTAAAVLAELAEIEQQLAGLEQSVVTARQIAATARTAAATAAPESATEGAAVAAEARLAATLQPLQAAAFRLEALAAATNDASDRAAYASQLEALGRRIAALAAQ
jgi:hypothetical protein